MQDINVSSCKNQTSIRSVKLNEWASKTPGFSGADLQNFLNEAAIIAARNEKTIIGSNELEIALEKSAMDYYLSPLQTTQKRQIAYQIIGKTLVYY